MSNAINAIVLVGLFLAFIALLPETDRWKEEEDD
jgi:hypothetical protein